MYAMKYMNKQMCARNDSLRNVLSEVELLKLLQHPFLVNLWFTFHDDEDLFIVVDLLLGGDLRYHMHSSPRSGSSGSRSGTSRRFDERRVKLYVCELALALDYLRQQLVVHRLLAQSSARPYIPVRMPGSPLCMPYKMIYNDIITSLWSVNAFCRPACR